MLELEHEHLMPMPAPFDGYVREARTRLGHLPRFGCQRSRYSVPCELAGQMISTRLYPSRVLIVAHDTLVASHERLSDRVGRLAMTGSTTSRCCKESLGALRNGAPFADMPEPLQRLRRAILREEGGDPA